MKKPGPMQRTEPEKKGKMHENSLAYCNAKEKIRQDGGLDQGFSCGTDGDRRNH